MNQIEKIRREIEPLRFQLTHHPVYEMLNSLAGLRVFMEHHVFAVWDFMSLLKRLQQLHTCVELPWRPKSSVIVSRFVNEIVLGEESDEDGSGGYISHFELYRSAMEECGACTKDIDRFIEYLGEGLDISHALAKCGAKPSVREFVATTWSFVTSAKPHCTAAAFTFGREDVIPDMFRQCVASLAEESGANFGKMRHYLNRHIDLDENTHAPMAIKVMHEMCGNDEQRWREASEAVRVALSARISLWNGIVSAIGKNQQQVVDNVNFLALFGTL